MKREGLLKKSIFLDFLAVLAIFSCAAKGSKFNVDLKIQPTLAITDDPVSFTCSHGPASNLAAVFYTLQRGKGEIVAEVNIKCETSIVTTKSCKFSPCNVEGSSCESLIIKDIAAQRDTMQDKYFCRVQRVSTDFNQIDSDSAIARLTVGDKTPPIKMFRVLKKETGEEIANGTQLDAGTGTNVRCQTEAASPEPGFIVSITGRENRTNLTIGHQVEFDETVPREPVVVYNCEAFNGFGDRQIKQITLLPTYPAIPSEVTYPTEVPIQTSEEITICSARNNPSRPLRITGIDQSLLQDGYPKYRQTLGMSFANVRLSDRAAEYKDAKLEFACHAENLGPVSATVALVSTNSAMMTAGIVVAAILAFVLIAAGIAYALKRRSATPKPASDKSGYGRVNQNDAATNNQGRRAMTASKLEELPSTFV